MHMGQLGEGMRTNYGTGSRELQVVGVVVMLCDDVWLNVKQHTFEFTVMM